MESMNPSKDDRIAIVGASVLGISTALHLAARGYKNIAIFDKRSQSDLTAAPSNQASPYAAVRCSPVDQPEYRNLSLEAITGWKAWNDELWRGKTVPPGMSPEHRVFVNNGFFSLFDGDAIPEAELSRVRDMEQKGMGLALLLSTDLDHVDSANSRMFNIDPVRREERNEANVGVMDTLGGTLIIEKACRFVLHKAQTQGVKFVLDPEKGAVEDIVYQEPGKDGLKDVKGVRTRDGKTHHVDFVVWACEPGNSIPSFSDTTITKPLVFTAAARVSEGGDLWDHLAPDNFPSWEHKLPQHQGAVIFGFPRDDDGQMIVVIRATAESNVVKNGGKDVALDCIKNFLAKFLPELKEEGANIEELSTNSPGKVYAEYRIIDRVPGVRNLILAADGRHAGEEVMFLPSIGSPVVDIMEGGKPAVTAWQWKSKSTSEPTINEGDKRLRKAKL
ncbi:hypothetical protein VMCG_06075 [Cytospora schulzeri]|uniref:FAD dependent oxidoreductase domain-containing protein n=1 Tax=Cytospora schulzeri TaxID=448051 RepID=A0A423WG72_9PEZI|nr:hypothetical protein VMCG_06075 [Valsa malicola]